MCSEHCSGNAPLRYDTELLVAFLFVAFCRTLPCFSLSPREKKIDVEGITVGTAPCGMAHGCRYLLLLSNGDEVASLHLSARRN